MEGGVLDVGFCHRDRNTGLVVGSGVMRLRIATPAYQHGGNWRVEGDELIQDAADSDLAFLFFGEPSWTDYDVTVEAQRIRGNDLGWVVFRCEDVLNYWALGVWVWNRGHTRVVLTRVDGIPKPVEEKGWAPDNALHKLAVRVRGERIRCVMDDDPIADFADSRHPRGYVALATTKTATRFRNLKVTDASGRALVDGIRSLAITGKEDRASGEAAVPTGSVWKGTFREVDGDIEHDLLIRIRKREGSQFEGDYWIDQQTKGLKIEGTIDPLGNISWKPTQILARPDAWFPDVCDTLMTGTVKGKRMRAYAIWPQHKHFTAEMTLTRDK